MGKSLLIRLDDVLNNEAFIKIMNSHFWEPTYGIVEIASTFVSKIVQENSIIEY